MIGRRAAVFLLKVLSQDKPLGRRVAARIGLVTRLAFALTLALYPFFAIASWVRLGVRKVLRRGPRVVFGPTPIISIRDQVQVLRRAGVDAESLVFTTYYITSDFDHNLFPLVANPATAPWFPNALFLWSLLRYDIYDYFYDGGLWSGMKIVPKAKWIELPLLRLAGKRVVMSAYGADVRVKAINERWSPNICAECPAPGQHCICTDDTLMNARHATDWANRSIAMGDMVDFVPGASLTPNHWPIDTDAVSFVGVTRHDGPVIIAHSPNHREFKGTRFLLGAVTELQRRGHAVEVDLIERVSNTEARRRYAEADIVFAQCLAGWMGYTEIEAMAYGKPVVTYLRNDDYLADSPGFPCVSAPPSRLTDELERLVTHFDARREMGVAARAWVEQYWSYRAVAPVLAGLHLDVWRHNRLWHTLRAKRADLRHGRGRWETTVPAQWTQAEREVPVTVDMQRLGGAILGLRSTPAVQAACSAMLVAARPRGVAPAAQVRAFVDLLIDRQVDCGATVAFGLFHATRALPALDPSRVALGRHALALAAGHHTDRADVQGLLDLASLTVALLDTDLHERLADRRETLDRAVAALLAVDALDWIAEDGARDVEQRFLLSVMLTAVARATGATGLSAAADLLATRTRETTRRMAFSLAGTW